MNLTAKLIHKTTLLFLLASLVSGCATVQLPLAPDEAYPPDWPKIMTAGVQCRDLDGTYFNEGIAVDEKGNQAPVMLTGLLEKWDSEREDRWVRIEKITLSVETKKLDRNGDSFAELRVVLEGERSDSAFEEYAGDFSSRNGLDECYCVKDTLVVGMRRQYSHGAPYIGGEGGDTALWLTRGSDGSLLVRIKDAKFGVAVLVPYGGETLSWAIFRPVGET